MKAYVVGGAQVGEWDPPEDAWTVIACHEHAHKVRGPCWQLSVDWVYWRDHKPRNGARGLWVDLGDSPGSFVPPDGVARLAGLELWAKGWHVDRAMVGGCSGVAAVWWAWRLWSREIELVGFTDLGASEPHMLYAIEQCAEHGVSVTGWPSASALPRA